MHTEDGGGTPPDVARRNPCVAAEVAAAIDRVARGPVLVVGSPPPGGRDLDLMAVPDDYTRIQEWLRGNGFAPWRHTWARFGEPGPYAVELSSTERWATSRHDATSLFDGAEAISGFERLVRPSPATVLLVAARGNVTRRGRMTDKVRRRVRDALQRDPEGWSHAEQQAPELGMLGALRLLRQAYNANGTLSLPLRARGLAGVLRGEGPTHAKKRLLMGGRPRRLRPALVSFSGLDGSGKSTQVSHLQENLRALGVTSDVQWAGFKSARKVRAVLPFVDRPRPGQDVTRDPLMPTALLGSTAGRQAWVYVVAGVNALHLWRLALRRRPGVAVLIFDRFTPDTTVKLDLHFLRSREIDIRRQRRLFTAITPKPDVCFLVDVDPKVAYGRRQEQTPEELAAMFQLYQEQVRRFDLRVLDGTCPGDDLATRVAVEAWRGLR